MVVVGYDVCAMIDRGEVLRGYAGLYVVATEVVACHDALYASVAVGFYYPYIVECVVHAGLVQDGALDKYDGRLLLLYPQGVVIAHGRVYDVVEVGELLRVVKDDARQQWSIYLATRGDDVAAPLLNECLSQGRGVHQLLGAAVGVVHRVAHDAEYARYDALATAYATGYAYLYGDVHGCMVSGC